MAEIDHKDRIQTLDIIRGIALAGILLVNVQMMTSTSFFKTAYGIQPEAQSQLDYILNLFIEFFVQGSFVSTFSFLFGMGFYLFMTKAKAKGWNEKKLFTRRLFILALFGLAHLVLFWLGDILLTYAVSGFFLLLFYQAKEKTLLTWSIILLSLFFLFYSTQMLIPEAFLEGMQAQGEALVAQAVQAYSMPFISAEWWQFRLTEELPMILGQLPVLIPYVLGIFLFGFYAAKKGWFQHARENRPFFKKLALISLAVTLPFWGLMAYVQVTNDVAGSLTAYYTYDFYLRIGALPLALFYISVITLLTTKEQISPLLQRFGAMGRMALTNYLSHTVIIVLFIHVTGLFDQISVLTNMMIVVAVIGMQLIWSPIILNKYQFGPLEALWRKGTYKGAEKK
ncbi:DUF418 domain-containing protein [Alkalicoccus daliensis]|uniref:DUF418 domain-containing protein n=1 Tax=Alkalicoccus daliensis TaxID=745820 RepID=A0A1H0J4I3_9BACI|nr:DUF418 domain-containing protein [Alkalicoccus daliensis]SDO38413.1 uncharacterized protein SAMN04488053_11261 [Alkalicoccus daliensis]